MLPKFKGAKYEESLKRVDSHAWVQVDLGTTWPRRFPDWTFPRQRGYCHVTVLKLFRLPWCSVSCSDNWATVLFIYSESLKAHNIWYRQEAVIYLLYSSDW